MARTIVLCHSPEVDGCEDCEPNRYRTYIVKWTADKSETLNEAADKLRELANELDLAALGGWRLACEQVSDGFIPCERG